MGSTCVWRRGCVATFTIPCKNLTLCGRTRSEKSVITCWYGRGWPVKWVIHYVTIHHSYMLSDAVIFRLYWDTPRFPTLPSLQNFKTALKEYHAAVHKTEPVESLKIAWQALQRAAACNCDAVGSSRGSLAWPRPMLDSEQSLATHVGATAKWLSQKIPSFEEDTGKCRLFLEMYLILWLSQGEAFSYLGWQEGSFHWDDWRSMPGGSNKLLCSYWMHRRGNWVGVTHFDKLGKLPLLWLSGVNSTRLIEQEPKMPLLWSLVAVANQHHRKVRHFVGMDWASSTSVDALDTVLTEFWMFKVTAGDPNIPQPDDPAISSTDFALDPVSLRLISAAIKAPSGLTQKIYLFHIVIAWRLHELGNEPNGGWGFWWAGSEGQAFNKKFREDHGRSRATDEIK